MPTFPSLIVHGGAGNIPKEEHAGHLNGVRLAAELGWKLLLDGRPALDVVEQVVRLLEDDPTYDAGRGSHLNSAGHIELDALIMDGATLNSGAVAAVQCIGNPISLARLVMDKTRHSLLVGIGAQAFAEKMGFPRLAEENLLVGRELERWKAAQHDLSSDGHGTVGAVARDSAGNIAAATSTGGTLNKLSGRVGDSPLIGSGAYADNLSGGASATGVGESLMKIVISKTACDLMHAGLNAQEAAEKAVELLSSERVKGSGGLITVDSRGNTGFAYNTPCMSRAQVKDGQIVASV
nr:isoaspartyl peptidase/L-asparaginase [Anaerolineae bacterium]